MSMKKIIKFILVLFWMSLIFYMSAQVANESSETTNIVIDVLYKIYCFFIRDNRIDILSFSNIVFVPVRKLAHFIEFAILGILVFINIKEYLNKNTVIISIILSIIYATSDEVHQLFVPGRAFGIKDILIDSCGAIAGIFFIYLVLKRWIKKQ